MQKEEKIGEKWCLFILHLFSRHSPFAETSAVLASLLRICDDVRAFRDAALCLQLLIHESEPHRQVLG